MSLFQCEVCGCRENTSPSAQGCDVLHNIFDWTGIEDRRGKKVCSACAPSKYRNGEPSGLGEWHGIFERVFLPLGMFKTNRQGNLEHIENGDTNIRDYEINEPL